MSAELASRLTILVTLVVLGYNIFQLTNGYAWMVAQIGQFREYAREEKVAAPNMRRYNLIVIGIMLTAYLTLLFFSGFAWWILGLVFAKYAGSALLSDQMQWRILQGKDFQRTHHRVIKADAFTNVLVLGGLLTICVAS